MLCRVTLRVVSLRVRPFQTVLEVLIRQGTVARMQFRALLTVFLTSLY